MKEDDYTIGEVSAYAGMTLYFGDSPPLLMFCYHQRPLRETLMGR